ncbi:MAG: YciI family protein, partial [Thermoanaerobaculia bacterium]
ERQAFSELARELPPPDAVEERIVSALRSRGLIRSGRPRARAWAAIGAVAAGIALLAAGYLLGRGSTAARQAALPESRFALFLLRGEQQEPARGEEEAARVEEYRAWARGLAGAGRFVTGEKLEDRGERLGVSGPLAAPAEEEIRGFFVISASDFEDALAVARGCPHLRYGGRILVRPIART